MAAIVTSTPRRCPLGEGEEGDGGNSNFDATAVMWALVLFRQLLGDMAAVEVLVGGSLVEGEEGDGGNSDFDATALPVGVPAGGSSSKVASVAAVPSFPFDATSDRQTRTEELEEAAAVFSASRAASRTTPARRGRWWG